MNQKKKKSNQASSLKSILKRKGVIHSKTEYVYTLIYIENNYIITYLGKECMKQEEKNKFRDKN